MKKIVNVKRFIVSTIVLLFIIGSIINALVNSTFSYSEPRYKTIYIDQGDTIWSIAKNEQENNEYYQNTDIQNIIISIKKTNDLKVSNLKVGQKLLIPII